MFLLNNLDIERLIIEGSYNYFTVDANKRLTQKSTLCIRGSTWNESGLSTLKQNIFTKFKQVAVPTPRKVQKLRCEYREVGVKENTTISVTKNGYHEQKAVSAFLTYIIYFDS